MTTIAQDNKEYNFKELDTDSWEYDSDEDCVQVPKKSPAQIRNEAAKAAAELARRKVEQQVQKEQDIKDIAAMAPKLNWIHGHKNTVEIESDEEFPQLGAEPKKKTRSPKDVCAPKGSSKTFTKLVITGKTYREERRAEREQTDFSEEKRSAAFEVLANKEGLEEQLTKTRMCQSVGKAKCRHGDNCRFAHSLDELRISTCFFKDECRFVKFVGDKVVDNGNKKCTHKHPSETEENFLSRTGLDRYKAKVEKPVEEPKVIEITKYTQTQLNKMAVAEKFEKKRVAESMSKPGAWARTLKHQVELVEEITVPKPLQIIDDTPKSLENETVLRVPKDLALQMLEVAMKSGKTNIRLEIF